LHEPDGRCIAEEGQDEGQGRDLAVLATGRVPGPVVDGRLGRGGGVVRFGPGRGVHEEAADQAFEVPEGCGGHRRSLSGDGARTTPGPCVGNRQSGSSTGTTSTVCTRPRRKTSTPTGRPIRSPVMSRCRSPTVDTAVPSTPRSRSSGRSPALAAGLPAT